MWHRERRTQWRASSIWPPSERVTSASVGEETSRSTSAHCVRARDTRGTWLLYLCNAIASPPSGVRPRCPCRVIAGARRLIDQCDSTQPLSWEEPRGGASVCARPGPPLPTMGTLSAQGTR